MKVRFLLFAFVAFMSSSWSQTVGDIIRDSDDHNTLEVAIDTAGLFGALDDPMATLTVFAPTDAAFAAIPAETISALLEDPMGDLTQILLYHVLGSTVVAEDITNGATQETLQGGIINFTADGMSVLVENALVSVTNLQGTNGVVHVIDAVLLPTRTTVLDLITDSDDHTILETAIGLANLNGTLSTDGPFTVFGPTDAAFQALPDGVLDALVADPSGDLTDILLHHVIVGAEVLAGDLSRGMPVTTASGETSYIEITPDNRVFIDNAEITMTDLEAANGVVHVIDAVLSPTRTTVVDIIVNSDDHTTLETAVGLAKLTGALSTDGPFTVFAPTDAAFAALPDGVLDALVADPEGELARVLLYHVAAGAVASGDVGTELIFPTLEGSTAMAYTDADGNVIVDGIQVTVADITTDNGVVHVLDASPILPDLRFVTDIIVESPAHDTLEAALATIGGNALFADPAAEVTIFAPTDAAFAVLGADVINELLTDQALLSSVIVNHIVEGEILAADIMDGTVVRAINNRKLTFAVDNGVVTVNGAVISVIDLTTDNGVVHVVDAVVPAAPFTILDVVELNDAVFATLGVALDATGLDAAVDNPDAELTVFAPTDAAFAVLGQDAIDALLSDPSGTLTDILTYHVIDGINEAGTLGQGTKLATLQGDNVNVSLIGDPVTGFVENAQIIQVDVLTDNGVVHVIDAVLDPARTTVNEIVEESMAHDTLEAAIGAAGLNGILSLDGTYTLFAPTDDAFAALPDGTIEALLSDPQGDLTEILAYHLIADATVLAGDLSKGMMVTSLLGETAFIEITADGRVFIDNAEIVITDLTADNGVVHVIDKVLTNRSTVVDVVIDSDVHTTLETAVVLAQLAGTLSGEGPFTVFAPVDDAFDALDPALLTSVLADPQGALTTVLTYHVVSGAVTSDMLATGMVPTVQGEMIDVVVDNGAVTVNGVNVIQPDIEVDNGVVHVIDGVLLPPSLTSTSEVSYEMTSVYPNPASEFITVELPSDMANAKYTIIATDGKVIQAGSLSDNRITVADMPSGQYTLAINAAMGNYMAAFIKID